MGRTERIEEQELLELIKDFRKEFRNSLRQKLLKDREERHARGEVLINSMWIPGDKIQAVLKKLARRRLVIFFEIHILVVIIILLNLVLFAIFSYAFLP